LQQTGLPPTETVSVVSLTPCMKTHSPRIAAALSLVIPGVGQIYKGERGKGAALLSSAVGIWAGILVATIGPVPFRSWLGGVSLAVVYPLIWVPAIRDAYQQDCGPSRPFPAGEKRWYVVLMLLAVGPMALPLLWQSRRFGRIAKIAWTTLVLVVVIGAISVLVVAGPLLEELLVLLNQSR
jgi:TM2 domain-containing membrane protein YozV